MIRTEQRRINTLCVFCGSSPGNIPVYRSEARKFGILLAEQRISLVYGGSNLGIMKEIADTVMEHGGKVTGVMPRALVKKEVAHANLDQLHIVNTMHERKALMAELSDAFTAFPGGLGTLDELFEILSWNQLEIIKKPCGLMNVEGYFDHLLRFLDHAVDQKFVRPEHRRNLVVERNPAILLEKLENFSHVSVEKWIDDLRQLDGDRP